MPGPVLVHSCLSTNTTSTVHGDTGDSWVLELDGGDAVAVGGVVVAVPWCCCGAVAECWAAVQPLVAWLV